MPSINIRAESVDVKIRLPSINGEVNKTNAPAKLIIPIMGPIDTIQQTQSGLPTSLLFYKF